ncbi:response regulator transcription factor [Nocardioides nanhaiensis]|uniref:Response regulator transcription factor n=1 Tax=Nocardioides nanhaiensis TaxID=1476871 RepID=A0ABP8VSC6_9ACTN
MTNWNAVVIEDDPSVRELLEIVLTQSGFSVVATEDGPAGLQAVRDTTPLVTTCDVSMPGMDGLAVARRIRDFSDTYLVMISGMGEEIDVVQGLEAGADDYVVKPFSPREVRARIDAMIRRLQVQGRIPEKSDDASAPAPAAPAEPADWVAEARRRLEQEALASQQGGVPAPPSPAPAPAPAPAASAAPGTYAAPAPAATMAPPAPVPAAAHGEVLEFNGLRVDLAARTVSGPQVGSEQLTRSEFELLATLLQSGRRVRSKADLVLALRGQGHVTSYFVNEADKRSVEVHMANLRRKIGDNATTPEFIETVRGVGYRLAPQR